MIDRSESLKALGKSMVELRIWSRVGFVDFRGVDTKELMLNIMDL